MNKKSSLFLLFIFIISLPLFSSDVFFSPNGGIRDQIIKRINLSKSSIDISIYSFTSGEIAMALADAHKRGVKIRVLRDKIQSFNKNDENKFLVNNGIEIKIIKGQGHGIMHNKFAIFDGEEVLTGSYNWTENAEKFNYENVIFLNEKEITKKYSVEFSKLWETVQGVQ